MSEKATVKKAKAKAPAKPRKATAKVTAKVAEPTIAVPTRDEIARLAEQYWVERGWQDGFAEQDWLRAERELMAS